MKYTYAIAPFNEKTGQIGDVITWKEGTLEEVRENYQQIMNSMLLWS